MHYTAFFYGCCRKNPTLDSGINIGVRLLIFWLFSRGYILIREGNAYFFQNVRYLMVLGMPILRATLNIFAKCSRSYVYSRGYVYSKVWSSATTSRMYDRVQQVYCWTKTYWRKRCNSLASLLEIGTWTVTFVSLYWVLLYSILVGSIKLSYLWVPLVQFNRGCRFWLFVYIFVTYEGISAPAHRQQTRTDAITP